MCFLPWIQDYSPNYSHLENSVSKTRNRGKMQRVFELLSSCQEPLVLELIYIRNHSEASTNQINQSCGRSQEVVQNCSFFSICMTFLRHVVRFPFRFPRRPRWHRWISLGPLGILAPTGWATPPSGEGNSHAGPLGSFQNSSRWFKGSRGESLKKLNILHSDTQCVFCWCESYVFEGFRWIN